MNEKLIADAHSADAVTTPEGATRKLLSHGGGMMAVQFEFPAGVVAPMHQHPHEQIGYVVSGELDFHMEGKDDVRLAAGASYYVPSNVMHGVTIHEPTVLLDVFTPIREDFLPQ